MDGDQSVVVNHSMAWTASGRLCNLSSYLENAVLVGDEPPYGITSLEKESVGGFLIAWGCVRLTRSGTSNSFPD